MKARTSSRESILGRLREYSIDSVALPQADSAELTEFDDPVAKFGEMLTAIGGQLHHVETPGQIRSTLQSMDEFTSEARVASLLDDVVPGNVVVAEITDPHALDSLDWVVVPGEFMVAENGAIWVDGARLPHRVMLFITQHLAIVVSAANVVHHMHQAYQRIARPPDAFGVFVAGPSKTADIEQSLVLGAHGCRSLHVFLVRDT